MPLGNFSTILNQTEKRDEVPRGKVGSSFMIRARDLPRLSDRAAATENGDFTDAIDRPHGDEEVGIPLLRRDLEPPLELDLVLRATGEVDAATIDRGLLDVDGDPIGREQRHEPLPNDVVQVRKAHEGFDADLHGDLRRPRSGQPS